MSDKRILTCIVCPRGCRLEVTLDEGRVTKVIGNACKRGESYALTECTNPKRTVTTTMKCADGSVISVKTKDEVPKAKVFSVMSEINKNTAPNAVRVGDILIENVADTGVAVVATCSK